MENPREKAVELAREIKDNGISNPLFDNLIFSLLIAPDDFLMNSIKKGIAHRLEYNRLFTSPFSKQNSVDGELRFAVTETGFPVGLNLNEVHTLIAGSSNTGKTVCLEILIAEAIKKGCRAWMFVKSDDITRIIRMHREIMYSDFEGSLRLNPLFFLSKEIFTTIFKDSFVLYEGSEGYLIESIKELKAKNENANLYDLYYFIRAKSHPALSRTARYRESILNRLEGILGSPLGKIFDCARGHEQDIVKSNAIFNIARLTLPEQKFFVNSLITLLYQNNAGGRTHLLAIDDANLLLQWNRNKEMSMLDDIFCNVRKGLIHIIACSQSPAELSSGVLSNSSNKIVSLLTSGKDREAMQRNMGVFDNEERGYFPKLNQSEFEVIVEFAKRARPFVARILKKDLLEPMSKKELYENNEIIMQGFSNPVLRGREKPEEKKQEISNDERKWLMAAYLNQFKKTVTEIHKIAGFSACKGTKIVKSCGSRNIMTVASIVRGKGVSKFAVLSDEAYSKLNLKPYNFRGKGCDYPHYIYQNLIAEHFKDFKPIIESNKGGKFIDIAIEHESRLIAVEVAMTSVNEKNNLFKDFKIAGAGNVIIACKDKKVKEEVMQIIAELPEEMRHKTNACLLSEILKRDLPELINQNKNQGE